MQLCFCQSRASYPDLTVTRYSFHINNGTAVYSLLARRSGFEAPWDEEIFFSLHAPRPALGPTQPLYNQYGSSFPGVMRPERGCDQTQQRLLLRLSIRGAVRLLPLCAVCGILEVDFGRA